jgi:nucleotide-binding universal stress UspA family protein
MSLFQNIVLSTDFSECARHAREYAHALAKESGGTLHVIHVIDVPSLTYSGLDSMYVETVSVESLKESAEKQLKEIVDSETDLQVNAQSHLKEGRPWQVISEFAEEIKADLIVIGTHGQSGFERVLFGSTCDRVLRSAKTPVLTVKPAEHEFVSGDSQLTLGKILCPVDFSDNSHSVLPLAAGLCRKLGASLTLCHVVDTRYDYPQFTAAIAVNNSEQLLVRSEKMLEDTAAEYSDIEPIVIATTGVPPTTVGNIAEREEIDLIVMATHGRSGLSRMFLGSVAEKILHVAKCPVLTVRPDGD